MSGLRNKMTRKPSWLVPWGFLDEPDKEVDRRIGEALWKMGREVLNERLAAAEDRVRVLEGALREVVAIVGPSDASMMKRLQTICRAALAKKEMGT